MAKTNGSIIGPANIPTGAFGSAPGVWKLAEAEKYIKEGRWPVATTGFQVANSCRFDDGSSDYLVRTPSVQSDLQKSTFSYWVKRSSLGEQILLTTGDPDSAGSLFQIYFTGNDSLHIETDSPSLITNRKFRDLSAWYHIVVAIDTTQATSSDRVKVYVNGVQETSFSTEQYPTLNANLNFNKTNAHYIGVLLPPTYTAYFDGYMSEVVEIDGQQLDATSFGETDATTGNWVPKDVSGLTFGTNGFYLPFQNAAALGQDDSGNGNNFTVNNLTSIDQCIDSPTNNFATGNPLLTGAPGTYSDGNLTNFNNSNNWETIFSTLAMSSGKWYTEVKCTTGHFVIGVSETTSNQLSAAGPEHFIGAFTKEVGYYSQNGNKYVENVSSAYGATYTTGDIIGMALDLDSGTRTITFYKNGVSQGAITLPSTMETMTFGVANNQTNSEASFNFGNPPFTISSGNTDYSGLGNFEYSVPSGYRALCTKNIGLVG